MRFSEVEDRFPQLGAARGGRIVDQDVVAVGRLFELVEQQERGGFVEAPLPSVGGRARDASARVVGEAGRAVLDRGDFPRRAIRNPGRAKERDGEGQDQARANRAPVRQGRASGTMTLSLVETVKRTSGRSSYAVVSPSFSYDVTSRSVVFPSSTWKL